MLKPEDIQVGDLVMDYARFIYEVVGFHPNTYPKLKKLYCSKAHRAVNSIMSIGPSPSQLSKVSKDTIDWLLKSAMKELEVTEKAVQRLQLLQGRFNG